MTTAPSPSASVAERAPRAADLLLLSAADRAEVWSLLSSLLERSVACADPGPVTSGGSPGDVRARFASLLAGAGAHPARWVEAVAEALTAHQVHTGNPRYFGLFNPAVGTLGIAGEALAAALNPQLAASSHAPMAAVIEEWLVRTVAGWFSLGADATGTFTSGGAEANLTAVALALHRSWPDWRDDGIDRRLGRPALYVSELAHDSLVKAARVCGLGGAAVRRVRTDSTLRLDSAALSRQIATDRTEGWRPFLIVGTAGATATGTIDCLPELSEIAEREGCWFHVDAAWGGAAAVSTRTRPCLEGISRADSITFDPHKWLAVPLGAGMLLTRHRRALEGAFAVNASYMPTPAHGDEQLPSDAFARSLTWSRRFTGLKLFLTLGALGPDGYARLVDEQVELGQALREALVRAEWRCVNQTPLPVICFRDARAERTAAWHRALCARIVQRGDAWISTVELGGEVALRACITSCRTGPSDVAGLVGLLNEARTDLGG